MRHFSDKQVCALVKLFCTLPGAQDLSTDELRTHACILLRVRLVMPSDQDATEDTTNLELEKLVNLCEGLLQHIESLHRPSVFALWREFMKREDTRRSGTPRRTEQQKLDDFLRVEYPLYDLSQMLHDTIEDVGKIDRKADRRETSERKRNDKNATAALNVTNVAAEIYTYITRKKPGFTSDSITGEVRGDWPKFLDCVFDQLWIKGSASSRVKEYARTRKSKKEALA